MKIRIINKNDEEYIQLFKTPYNPFTKRSIYQHMASLGKLSEYKNLPPEQVARKVVQKMQPKISDLTIGQTNIMLTAKIIKVYPKKERPDKQTVQKIRITDQTGTAEIDVWNNNTTFKEDQTITIIGAMYKKMYTHPETKETIKDITLGKYGQIK